MTLGGTPQVRWLVSRKAIILASLPAKILNSGQTSSRAAFRSLAALITLALFSTSSRSAGKLMQIRWASGTGPPGAPPPNPPPGGAAEKPPPDGAGEKPPPGGAEAKPPGAGAGGKAESCRGAVCCCPGGGGKAESCCAAGRWPGGGGNCAAACDNPTPTHTH